MRQDWDQWEPRRRQQQGAVPMSAPLPPQMSPDMGRYFDPRQTEYDTGAYGQHPYVDELGRPFAQQMYKGEQPDKMGLGQMMEAPQMPGMPYQMPTSGGKPFQYPDRSGGKPFQGNAWAAMGGKPQQPSGYKPQQNAWGNAPAAPGMPYTPSGWWGR